MKTGAQLYVHLLSPQMKGVRVIVQGRDPKPNRSSEGYFNVDEVAEYLRISSRQSYDNALAGSVIGLFKTELIYNKGPWGGLDDVEFGSLEWVDWWNNRRLLEPIGMVPPAEAEALYYSQGELVDEAGTQAIEPL